MENKLNIFLKRNKRRNKHLWDNDKIEGIDYVICPVTGTRLSMIKKNYIENTLNIKYDDFLLKYPNVNLICSKRKENISKSLLKIDENTGKTRATLIAAKAKETLSKIDPKTGLTKNMLRINKTKISNKKNIINGRNGYERTIHCRKNTILENGLTLEQNLHLKGINTMVDRGQISKYRNSGIEYVYRYLVRSLSWPMVYKLRRKNCHVDHIYPVGMGFAHKISPLVLSHKNNLRTIPANENLMKKCNIPISKEILFEVVGITQKQNDLEFDAFIKAYNKINSDFSLILYKEMLSILEK